MFNFDLDYFLLNLLLLLIFIIAGNKISFGRKKEKYIWICFIVFTFVLGSRYLRGNDYLRYQHTFLYDDDESQIIFTAINRFLRGIGIGKYYFLYIYSIPFIVCALTFMKNLKIYARYLFPAFLLSFIFFNEYCIRQALGFSFVFMYMYYLFEKDNTLKNENVYKKWIFCLFYAILAYGIHSVNALSIAIITIIYIFSFTTISWKLSILGYIFAAFFFMSFFDWSYLENALMLIGGISDKFSAYTNRGVLFFSENAFQEDYSRSTLGQLCSAISHCSLFYLGDKTIRSKCNSRMFYTLFNVYVVGTMPDIFIFCYISYSLYSLSSSFLSVNLTSLSERPSFNALYKLSKSFLLLNTFLNNVSLNLLLISISTSVSLKLTLCVHIIKIHS